MSRPLEDILFGAPSPQARTVTRVVSVIAAAVLLLMAAAVVFRFHSAGQLEPRLWEFFARPTTWAFLGKGLLGTLASAAMAAVIALMLSTSLASQVPFPGRELTALVSKIATDSAAGMAAFAVAAAMYVVTGLLIGWAGATLEKKVRILR